MYLQFYACAIHVRPPLCYLCMYVFLVVMQLVV